MLDPELRRAMLANLVDLPSDARIAVGLSGGADSVAVLRVALGVGRDVVALVVDHGLQANSAAVAAAAAQLATKLGAHAEVLRVAVESGPRSGGPEAAARTARRAALLAAAEEHGCAAILLGHTLDDQAETVLLGLARGSGARSLAGMRAHEGMWRRPFLAHSRERVRTSVADLETFEDPHNSDQSFARVQVRTQLLPLAEHLLGPGISQALARSADLLRDDADALDALALATDWDGAVEPLLHLSRALRTRVLRRWLIAAGCPANDLTREHVLQVEGLAINWHGQGPLDLPGGIKVLRESGRLDLKR